MLSLHRTIAVLSEVQTVFPRAKACPPGRRGITSEERNQALSLRTSLRLNSPSQETPRGQQGPFFPIPYEGKKCVQRRPNRRCNARLRKGS